MLSAEAGAQTTLRPIIAMERDPSGVANIRVTEVNYSPFTPSRTIQNLTNSGRVNITWSGSTLVSNVDVRRAKYGVHISGSAPVSINRFSMVDWEGSGSIHGGGIKLERQGSGPTYIQRVFADGLEAPDPTYRRSNTDFLGVEFNANPVYMRGATGRNFGDGGVDAKSGGIYLMNVTIDGAYRGLRAWRNTQITIVDSIVNVPSGMTHVWLYDGTASIRHFRTLWCIGATNPYPGHPNCSSAPTAIDADNISDTQARQRIVALTSNPLPGISPFFATRVDRIVVQYSSNGGATWQTMNLPAAGASGRPPVGDTRYRIPLNLASANYLFRAYFQRGGTRVGSISSVINESGQAVSV
jgi:hypothetical protein